VKTVRIYSGLALVIAVVLAFPVYPGDVQKNTSERAQLKEKEFNQIKARAALLTKKLGSSDPGESTRAKAEWQKLVADFNEWGKKYDVATKTETGPFSVGASGAKRRCPPDHEDGPCYFCILDPSRTDKCYYICKKYCR
jgi:hypothetical protein